MAFKGSQLMRQMTIIGGIIYYDILGEIVFVEDNSKWRRKSKKQKLQSLRDRGLIYESN